ncbi:hypothetical protein [Massilia glaciei]|uniref:O-antigen polysaccharide polymerase Wzy n=1 Tax=Massilia glaciei TaxID=1524097 RepID=A0A2U2HN48_9BURK|nr:hypothetical protein [Massilia glaciei]PWF48927.1 hypothetical protein C7C56_009430 [Massilia glaciei]
MQTLSIDAPAAGQGHCARPGGDVMRAYYWLLLLVLNVLMATMPWGSIYLSLIIIITYLTFRPAQVLHPNNMIFAFYGMYVVLSSTLNFILHMIDWEYVLPWGQMIYWDQLSRYTLFQAESTFLVLYFAFHRFARPTASMARAAPPPAVVVRPVVLQVLYLASCALTFWFIQATAGLQAWLTDYSVTYLSMREGHGLLNIVAIAFGNITVFLLGVQSYHSRSKTWPVLAALLIMIPLSMIGGIKGRAIFLLILFFSPYLMQMAFSLRTVATFAALFFVLLYLGTLLRTEGFYASAPFFLEMMIGYFNSFQLHDSVVATRDPAGLQTVFMIFIKPLQTLGFVTDMDANFDISVMLTKEFFPDQWYLEHATQQWPLDTELYLNYYGMWLGWLPLVCYAYAISILFRYAVLKRNYHLVPIFMVEFIRIFATMRGTIVPWEVFFFVGQYTAYYLFCRLAIKVIPAGEPKQYADQQRA